MDKFSLQMESLRIQMVVLLMILVASLTVNALEKEEFESDRDKIIAENLKDEIPMQMKEMQENLAAKMSDKPGTDARVTAENISPEKIQNYAYENERSSHTQQCAPRKEDNEYECDSKYFQRFVPCRKGWFLFGEKCYKIFLDFKTWREASQNCSKEGGHLATVSSKELQEFMNAFFLLNERVDVYIGANDIETETVFVWEDGSPFIYTNWHHDQPDDASVNEDCVEMRFDTFAFRPRSNPRALGFWNDRNCIVPLPYICQRDTNTGAEQLNPDPRFCPINEGGGFKYRDSCFHIVRRKKSWDEAEKHCVENFSGHLVTILDTEDEMFLNYILSDFEDELWIGIRGQDKAVQNWNSGWPVAHNRLNRDLRQFRSGTCVLRSKNTFWSTAGCSCEFQFICEIRKSPAPVLKKAPEGHRCPNTSNEWLDLGGDSCYIFGTNLNLNWQEANAECERKGGHLTSITSKEEDMILQNFVLRYRRIHIGFRRSIANKKVFEWIDGSRVEYTKWTRNEPNNLEEECVEMKIENIANRYSWTSYSYRWNDRGCNSKGAASICKAKKVLPRPM